MASKSIFDTIGNFCGVTNVLLDAGHLKAKAFAKLSEKRTAYNYKQSKNEIMKDLKSVGINTDKQLEDLLNEIRA